ncbi:MAG: AtpZ/AtpI family protein [Actinobacteria bacterium]|nr:AtpZ/AtpI family protein [Actinomycetota bacterium]
MGLNGKPDLNNENLNKSNNLAEKPEKTNDNSWASDLFENKKKPKLNIESGSVMQELKIYGGLGVELLSGVVVGALIGYWIDNLLGLKVPWGILIGSFIGSIAGFINIYNVIVKEEEKKLKTNTKETKS